MGICSKEEAVVVQNEKRQNIFFVITMILMSIYLVWRTFFTLPWGEGVLNVIFGMLLIVAETVTVLTTFELFFQKMQKERTQARLSNRSAGVLSGCGCIYCYA